MDVLEMRARLCGWTRSRLALGGRLDSTTTIREGRVDGVEQRLLIQCEALRGRRVARRVAKAVSVWLCKSYAGALAAAQMPMHSLVQPNTDTEDLSDAFLSCATRGWRHRGSFKLVTGLLNEQNFLHRFIRKYHPASLRYDMEAARTRPAL